MTALPSRGRARTFVQGVDCHRGHSTSSETSIDRARVRQRADRDEVDAGLRVRAHRRERDAGCFELARPSRAHGAAPAPASCCRADPFDSRLERSRCRRSPPSTDRPSVAQRGDRRRDAAGDAQVVLPTRIASSGRSGGLPAAADRVALERAGRALVSACRGFVRPAVTRSTYRRERRIRRGGRRCSARCAHRENCAPTLDRGDARGCLGDAWFRR